MTTPAELFKNEVKQADIDHHTPTAGAMTGHVVANLVILANKLQQAKWYVKGINATTLKELFDKLLSQAYRQKDDLGKTLIDENLIVPSVQEEFDTYTMLEENGQNKYETADWLINNFVHDYDTENMFITRAIKLANKEDRPVLALALTNLLAANKHNIATLQALLGKTARDGLNEEE
ncbi:ferritin-like domain-containing protein [Weissella thailandensis]|uniref:ferritin-like domain-containing protein n=1 Tax=Weissella thailandensis TaxID=89061 RepID=UPI0027E55DCE|nr:ferritin-like domain-containing protein [Weissella thailandensis]